MYPNRQKRMRGGRLSLAGVRAKVDPAGVSHQGCSQSHITWVETAKQQKHRRQRFCVAHMNSIGNIVVSKHKFYFEKNKNLFNIINVPKIEYSDFPNTIPV